MKRRHSSESSASSFVTADSTLEHRAARAPNSLKREVSPPPTNRKKHLVRKQKSATATVEAGEVNVEDHVAFFSQKLSAARLQADPGRPQLGHAAWLDLYQRNDLDPRGHHYIVHQHDHPVAGTHYDLRLQCNATSSISFAIMYGLPGDPNSRRLNRNATETRVHCLWNHLIETASYETGTMLIWDTGEYEVLPYYAEQRSSRTADSECESDSEPAQTTNTSFSTMSQPEKLAYSFARRKIRIRLHGTRLPPGYTLGIRLNHENDRATQPKAPSFKRKRKQVQLRPTPARKVRRISTSSSSSVASNATKDEGHRKFRRTISSLKRTASPPSRDARLFANYNVGTADSDHSSATYNNDSTIGLASEGEDENEAIRLTNAYPGATNSIGSIHQRKWYLSMDRSLSGFVPIPTPKDVNHHAKTYWIRGEKNDGRKTGFERFHVLGRDVERSVVTGRLAADILRDEGVEGYVPRGMWRGVTE